MSSLARNDQRGNGLLLVFGFRNTGRSVTWCFGTLQYDHSLRGGVPAVRRTRLVTAFVNIISILSLIIAILAVFIGPLISWHIAKRQVESSANVANKQITAPMRQEWINDLRELVAELTSSALHYFTSGHESEGYKHFQRLTFLESKIQLMLNPNEEDHQKLEWMIGDMMKALQAVHRGEEQGKAHFIATHPEVIKLSRQVFKREWNRVKDKIEVSSK